MTLLAYSLDPTTLPEAEDLFAELDELYADVTRVRENIERAFNASTTRAVLQGFVEAGKTDLQLEWVGARARLNIVRTK